MALGASSTNANELSEITVTAERRTENMQNVPIAIHALTGESRQQLSIENFDDMIRYLPNLTVAGAGPVQNNIYMRGLSVGSTNIVGNGAVGNYSNVSVYLGDQSVQVPGRNLDVYAADIERIDILEGPPWNVVRRAEILNDAHSVTPEGYASDFGVADVEALRRLKAVRGRQVVDLTVQLLGYGLITANYWLDVRKAQDSKRNFAYGLTAVWTAFRKLLPWQLEVDSRPDLPYGAVAYNFLKQTPASTFYAAVPVMPATDAQFMAMPARPEHSATRGTLTDALD